MMQKKSKLIGAVILTIVGAWGMIITLLSDVLIKWILQWQFAKAVGENRNTVSIIGGADGPTAVFFVETQATIGSKLLLIAILAVCTGIGIILLVKWGRENTGK